MLYLENLFVLFLNVTIIVSPTSARITGPKNPKWSSFSFTVLNVLSLYSMYKAFQYLPPIESFPLAKNS